LPLAPGRTPSSKYAPEALSRSRPLWDLPEQFVLGREAPTLDGWSTTRLGPWFLSHHPSLPRISVRGLQGEDVGWILGYPIDGQGLLRGNGASMVAPGEPGGFQSAMEELGGRFLGILAHPTSPRVYPDACGSYSSVYCPEQRLAASTPNLIPYSDGTRDHTALVQALGIPYSNSMYPVGLTPRHGVFRLLPNHYLDLKRWESRRYWPHTAFVEVPPTGDQVADLAGLIRRQIEAVARTYPCYLSLTAGWDSRTLLACAGQLAREMTLYTVEIPDWGATTDAALAGWMAKRLGLRYQSVPWISPMEEDLEEWMFRIGCSVGEVRGWQASTSYKSLEPHRVRLVGDLGNFSRGDYWNRDGVRVPPPTPELLAERCGAGVSASEEALQQLSQWLDSAPDVGPLHLWDLFHIEQRYGCWGGVYPYAEYAGPGFVGFPLCHRKYVEGVISMPPETRLSGWFNKKVMEMEWPELMRWPVNSLPLHLRLRGAVRRRWRRLRSPPS